MIEPKEQLVFTLTKSRRCVRFCKIWVRASVFKASDMLVCLLMHGAGWDILIGKQLVWQGIECKGCFIICKKSHTTALKQTSLKVFYAGLFANTLANPRFILVLHFVSLYLCFSALCLPAAYDLAPGRHLVIKSQPHLRAVGVHVHKCLNFMHVEEMAEPKMIDVCLSCRNVKLFFLICHIGYIFLQKENVRINLGWQHWWMNIKMVKKNVTVTNFHMKHVASDLHVAYSCCSGS